MEITSASSLVQDWRLEMEENRRPAEIITYDQIAGLHDIVLLALGQMRISIGAAIALMACLLEEVLRKSQDPNASFNRFLIVMQQIRMSNDFDPKKFLHELVDANAEVVVDYAIKEITKGGNES